MDLNRPANRHSPALSTSLTGLPAWDVLVPESLRALELVFGTHRSWPLRIELWNGAALEPAPGVKAQATLRFNHPGGLRAFLTANNQVELAEGYIYGDYDLEGDLDPLLTAARQLLAHGLRLRDRARIAYFLMALPKDSARAAASRRAHPAGQLHSRPRDAAAVRHHYDVSNAFYALWLDQRMVYSCAYFERPGDTIDQAQEQKLDHICRKLRLGPGDRLLDIGCGWGGLVIHAVRHYGVTATGITLSDRQHALATERVAAAGLADRCRIEQRDYRDLPLGQRFTKIASVGMFEHVGRSQFDAYFSKAWSLLEAGGVFLNHAIAEPPAEAGDGEPTLINTYVFPDAELVPVAETLTAAERAGFEIRDVENLREHYHLTLRRWVERLEARHSAAVADTDEATYRVWRLYMSGAAAAFRAGALQVHQALLAKPDAAGNAGLPLTRADWYRRA